MADRHHAFFISLPPHVQASYEIGIPFVFCSFVDQSLEDGAAWLLANTPNMPCCSGAVVCDVMWSLLCWPMPDRCCDWVYDEPNGAYVDRFEAATYRTYRSVSNTKAIAIALDATLAAVEGWETMPYVHERMPFASFIDIDTAQGSQLDELAALCGVER